MDRVVLDLVIILVIGILLLIGGIKTEKKWLIVISVLPLTIVAVAIVIRIMIWLLPVSVAIGEFD